MRPDGSSGWLQEKAKKRKQICSPSSDLRSSTAARRTRALNKGPHRISDGDAVAQPQSHPASEPPRPGHLGHPARKPSSCPAATARSQTRALGKERSSRSPAPHKSHLRPKVLENKTRRLHQRAKEVARLCLRSPGPSARAGAGSGVSRSQTRAQIGGGGGTPFGGQGAGPFGRARGLAQGLSGTRD